MKQAPIKEDGFSYSIEQGQPFDKSPANNPHGIAVKSGWTPEELEGASVEGMLFRKDGAVISLYAHLSAHKLLDGRLFIDIYTNDMHIYLDQKCVDALTLDPNSTKRRFKVTNRPGTPPPQWKVAIPPQS